MKTTTKFFGLILFLFGVLCFSGCSSSDDDGDSYVEDEWGETGAATGNFNPTYSDYIGTSDFKTDYAHLLDLAVAVQYYKDNMFLAYLDDDSTPFAGDPVPEAIDALVSLEGEINEMYDEYKPSLDRLMQSGILDTESPTRGYLGAAWASFKFFVTCKNTGENSRKTMLGVLAQNPEDSKEIFDNLPTNWKQGETDYAKWIQNMSEGKYDNIASAMYSEVYNTSGALWMDNRGGKLWEYANDHKVRPKDNLNNAAPELWAAGAGFATSYLTTAKTFPGVITNIKDAALGSKVAGEALVIPIGVSVGAVATNMTTNMLSKTTNKTEAEKNALKKDLEKASEQYINKLKNESNPKTTVDVKDSDGSSPATTVIVTDKDGNTTFGIGGTKVPVNLDGQQNGTVTAVDETGDKFTKTVPLTPGQNNQVEGSSNEKEKMNNLTPYIELSETSLYFKCDASRKTINVDTNYPYIRVRKTDKKVDWLTVQRSGKSAVYVTVKDNDDDNGRSTSIVIDFSLDKKTASKSITIPVSQEGHTEEDYEQNEPVYDLSFIDLPTFTIDAIEAGKGGQTIWIARFFNGYVSASDDLPKNKPVKFDTKDIKITKESDACYLVTAKYQNVLTPADFGDGASPNESQVCRFDLPYGYYFDISFRMVVVPWYTLKLIDENDPAKGAIKIKEDRMALKDMKVKGYSKTMVNCSYDWIKVTGYDENEKRTRHHVDDWYDKYIEFSFEHAEQFGDDYIKGGENGSRHSFYGDGYFKKTLYNYEEHYITKEFIPEDENYPNSFRSSPKFKYNSQDIVMKNFEAWGPAVKLSWK